VRAEWLLVAALGCGDNLEAKHLLPYFAWGDQRQVGAMDVDRLDPTNDGPLLATLPRWRHPEAVVMLYAHVPGAPLSTDELARVLASIDATGLPMLTFADLAAGGAPRPALCLSFDDNSVAEWFAARDLLAGHPVTFFVTEYYAMTDGEKQMLHVLAGDGHDIEAHGVHHVNGPEYVVAYGLDEYLAHEVLPSVDVLRADGYAPVAFAHPYGARSDEIDAAILEHLALVRGISSDPR
jgi:hypothetical protein